MFVTLPKLVGWGGVGGSQCAAFPWCICKGRSYNYFLLQIKQNGKSVCLLIFSKENCV